PVSEPVPGAREPQQRLVRSLRANRRIGSGLQLAVAAVRLHEPGAGAGGETDLEDLPEARAKAPFENRNGRLDALGEVAVHPAGRADQEPAVERILGPCGEREDPRSLA